MEEALQMQYDPSRKTVMKRRQHFFIQHGLDLPKIQLFDQNFNVKFDGRDVEWESIMTLVMKGKVCVRKIDPEAVGKRMRFSPKDWAVRWLGYLLEIQCIA